MITKEEIEELKDFTIDVNDIDELALGLEVCSKKSNMVIQEFANLIIELQQENQSLQKENKILRENAEHNDKVVDKFNWENLKLKKQLEEERNKVREYSYKLSNFRCEETYENQQKKFIEYLEYQVKLQEELNDIHLATGFEEILSKYKEIIG